MAVYTSITKNELIDFLKQYNLGKLISYEGIIDGIENSNYKVITEKEKLILTIFEKRVDPEDIPFFMNLQKHLSKYNFHCPIPIENKSSNIINSLNNKNAILVSFLEGQQINSPNSNHCFQVGKMISDFQKITKSFNDSRKNSLNLNKWKEIFLKCLKIKDEKYLNLFESIDKELIYLENIWPKKLPEGIIHADIFQDNVFFENNKITGLIDFYFSCNDFFAYELAMTTNAWCFEKNGVFIKNNFDALLKGYLMFCEFNDYEKSHFNTLLRGAAIRILLTRLHDKLFHPDGAIVIQKDPIEYFNILKWHQNENILIK